MEKIQSTTLSRLGNSVASTLSNVISNGDFMTRAIGQGTSYDDLMMVIQLLGRKPVSLLGKNFTYIFDHVRRNYLQGTSEKSSIYGLNGSSISCPKFTFYKEVPTVRFADPYTDSDNYLGGWIANMEFGHTQEESTNITYAESMDGIARLEPIEFENASPQGGHSSHNIVSAFNDDALPSCDILRKTYENFQNGRYQTLISRFHTNTEESKSRTDPTQTANTKQFGMSHGRNLLKLNPSTHSGYDNPYCRVWTAHHEYAYHKDTIRPFDEISQEAFENTTSNGNGNSFRVIAGKSETDNFESGSKRLDKYGVLNPKNGLVTIAPTARLVDYFNESVDDKSSEGHMSPKRCMFSIENLAWRDKRAKKSEFEEYGLSPEQRGPLGGRIMWFPPYNLNFSEDVSVDWNGNQFIGRGEKVYTYSNTERRGNLSFTLLIDHPSLVDYWSRKDASGNELAEANEGGVDNKNNEENTLLRFFAGCDVLYTKKQRYQQKVETNKEEKVDVLTPEPQEVPTPTSQKIVCVLYYPNNYSGRDDRSDNNAIKYLMNGVGTNKYVDSGNTVVDSGNTVVDSGNTVDMPFDTTQVVKVNGVQVGGYEMRIKIPLDYGVDKALANDYDKVVKTYTDITSREKKAQLLTDSSGNTISAHIGGSFYTLAKQVYDGAPSLAMAKQSPVPESWYRQRWYYRVDKNTVQQVLNGYWTSGGTKYTPRENYIDSKSFGLNSVQGFEYPLSNSELKQAFGLDEDNVTLVSFADMYVALTNDRSKDVLKGCYNPNTVKIIQDVLAKKDGGYKIQNVRCNGHASKQARNASQKVNKTRNTSLAQNRAATLMKWFKEAAKISDDIPNVSSTVEIEHGSNLGSTISENNINLEETKAWRSAALVIEYTKETIENAVASQETSQDKIAVQTQNSGSNGILELDSATFNKINNEIKNIPCIQQQWRETQDSLDALDGEFDERFSNVYTDLYKSTIKEKDVPRYDNEGEFFKLLTKEDPLAMSAISEKVKYFDPAFHSISPEGFNARLTFLHQCTRQGPTVGTSDMNVMTANNLAFGRPPVCVLRLGDFYYTKILINSVSISYEEGWDLNQEGIGVMPMFAKINIGFTFLGGSDIEGPIARLQNAVSFNYYANTSIYDNRADKVKYDPSGNGKEISYKAFLYSHLTGNTDNQKLGFGTTI